MSDTTNRKRKQFQTTLSFSKSVDKENKKSKGDNQLNIESDSSVPDLDMETKETESSRKALEAPAKKKMVIKPFKVQPKPPEFFEENTLKKLELAVERIYASSTITQPPQPPSSLSLSATSSSSSLPTDSPVDNVYVSQEELYRSVESLCMHRKAEVLYQRLHAQCKQHIIATIKYLHDKMPLDDGPFLSLVDRVWRDHTEQMHSIRMMFLYLDRTYVIQNAKVRSLWEMGLELFCEHLQEYGGVESKVTSGLLNLIERERQGEAIDRSMVRNLVRMFISLKLYKAQDGFEFRFMMATHAFYESEASLLMATMNVADYLAHVSKRLLQEYERVVNYLDEVTQRPLIKAVENKLIKDHIKDILQKGFTHLMGTSRIADLNVMYSLLARVESLKELQEAFSAFIKVTGKEIVVPPDKDKVMIEELLKFKDSLDDVMKNAFQSNPDFLACIRQSFEHFINERPNKPAELVAKYVDNCLRSGNKGFTEEELERMLDKIMFIFRYIHGKDVFQAFYRKDLAKRLLLGKSASVDTEKLMITKLKTECGATFTTKLEGMFKDIDLSRDIMNEFSEHIKKWTEAPAVDMTVQVLTTGSWPAYTPMDIALPADVGAVQNEFKTFYLGKHSGRRLVWQNSLATCVLKAELPHGVKEFAVSGFQAVVLTSFNEASRIQTFDQLQKATKIEPEELKTTLESLVSATAPILLKNPKASKVTEKDLFQVNMKFKHKLYRIQVNSVQMKETKADQKETEQRVFQDRQYSLDATIVRIMKSRKTMNHNQLLADVFAQVKFPVTPADVKKRIGSLIEREYMERDKDNPNVYTYQA